MKLDPVIVRRLWPRAPQAKIDAICAVSEDVFADNGIDDVNVVVQLMANISHENGAGTIVRESGNYRAERIIEIFGFDKVKQKWRSSAQVTDEEAQGLAHNSRALFERVYNLPNSPKLAKELGNQEQGDGYKFRGGGDLQLTGRDSYERIGKLTGNPEIAADPDKIADPVISFTVAVAEFKALKCIEPAKLMQTTRVRRLVNGGTNGLAEVTVWVQHWADALPDTEPPVIAPRGADTDNKTLMGSKIMKGVASTAGSAVVAGAAQVAKSGNTTTETVDASTIQDHIQHAHDTITTVQSTVDASKVLVQTVKPFLGLPANLWATIAIVAVIISVGMLAYTGWQRWVKLRDEGV